MPLFLFCVAWCGCICPFGALQDQLPSKGEEPILMQKKRINYFISNYWVWVS
ncbi:4Fe-4S binding protein [Lacrimispora sp. AGF001]|uniref:4Fe-4S binding protein n=1 Tax=Lacrimispora sp. AGF001 TaxID=3401631 RepID=UPI003B436CDD